MLVALFLVPLAAEEDEMQILDAAVASDLAGDVMLLRTGMEYLGANVLSLSSLSDESLSLLEELDDDNGLSNPALLRDFCSFKEGTTLVWCDNDDKFLPFVGAAAATPVFVFDLAIEVGGGSKQVGA